MKLYLFFFNVELIVLPDQTGIHSVIESDASWPCNKEMIEETRLNY